MLQQNSLSADTTSYVGYSVNVMVMLYREQRGNTSYIFDFGNSLAGIRFSLYLNLQNELCYRIVDTKNNVRTIAIDTMTGNFKFDELIFITCEYGETEGNSFQRILINGREIEKHTFATNLKLSEAAVRLPGAIGADFTGENCAKIFIGASMLLHSTLTGKETIVLAEATRNLLNAVDFKNEVETRLLNCDKYYYIDPSRDGDQIRDIK